jgi:hypothetical protein
MVSRTATTRRRCVVDRRGNTHAVTDGGDSAIIGRGNTADDDASDELLGGYVSLGRASAIRRTPSSTFFIEVA